MRRFLALCCILLLTTALISPVAEAMCTACACCEDVRPALADSPAKGSCCAAATPDVEPATPDSCGGHAIGAAHWCACANDTAHPASAPPATPAPEVHAPPLTLALPVFCPAATMPLAQSAGVAEHPPAPPAYRLHCSILC